MTTPREPRRFDAPDVAEHPHGKFVLWDDAVEMAYASIEAHRPGLGVWRGVCGHVWEPSIDGDDCPRCNVRADALAEVRRGVEGLAHGTDCNTGWGPPCDCPIAAVLALLEPKP